MGPWSKRWRVLAWVTTVICVTTLYEAFIVSTHHLGSPWEAHAKFHALSGGLYLGVLAVTALLLAWGPLRTGERATRIAFVLVMLAIPGVALAASAAIPAGAAPALDRTLATGGLIAALVMAIACYGAE